MSISSGKIIHKIEVAVDQNFSVPPGTSDIRYRNDEDVVLEDDTDIEVDSEESVGNVFLGEEDADSEFEDYDADDDLELPIPDEMEILEQILHISEDGTTSVDVVLLVPDYVGINQIDVRLTKI